MLPPDDTYAKASASLKSCRELLQGAKANFASPDQDLRHEADETIKALGELSKMVTIGKAHTLPADMGHTGISSLAGLLDVINRDSANGADKVRQKLARKTLDDLDRLASAIVAASKTPGRVA
jgi:hypothetical protein